jgi:hypothetical protein
LISVKRPRSWSQELSVQLALQVFEYQKQTSVSAADN